LVEEVDEMTPGFTESVRGELKNSAEQQVNGHIATSEADYCQ
jgi:hypothetical protein